VLFVPTDFIGSSYVDGSEPEEAICGWDDLLELERCGVSVQSHGASHRSLSKLGAAEQKEEVLRSKAMLQGRLGKCVEVFAYPYGDGGSNPKVLRNILKQADYQAACLYGGGPNRVPITDPYRLTRLAMGPDTDLRAALTDAASV
jgi:peptidoglycan/xylan/chitin deacetylase (PgdA/CDA1 family)